MFGDGLLAESGSDQPGTWSVSVSGKATSVSADRWDYADNGDLQFWKGTQLVANFRWYDSIVRTGDE